MSRRAEFSERQYESAMNLELLSGAGEPLLSAPTQPAEAALGYDIALVPALSSIWDLLGFTTPAPGVIPGSGILAHKSAPAFAASLFLQYKRPEEMRSTTAREAGPRTEAGADPCVPFFRYAMDQHQMETLLQLSREVEGGAAVCYAAPAFVELGELHDLQLARSVVIESNFLPLPELEAALPAEEKAIGSAHVWTYGERGLGGVLCSEPIAVTSWPGRDLRRVIASRAADEGSEIQRHLIELDQKIRSWESDMGEPELDRFAWFSRAAFQRRRFGQAPPEVSAALNIQNAISRRGLGWLLALAWPNRT